MAQSHGGTASHDHGDPMFGNERSNGIHSERALGFWLYLMSDAIIFAVLFANFAVLLPGVGKGPQPHQVLEIGRAGKETALLLLSSLTFGVASISALSAKRDAAIMWLAITFLLGGGFLYLELQEFRELIARGAGPQVSGFLSGFFSLVGTHGLHVSFGMLMLLGMIAQLKMKGITEPVLSRFYRVGLFWHFLDIIWIAIFSFVYLPGAIQ